MLSRLADMCQIEPFQGDPQLLDTRLKHILPPIVEAYLEYIGQKLHDRRTEHIDLQIAVCAILYTLCKVRGYKIVSGFLNNEPRYLEPVLDRLDTATKAEGDQTYQWQVQYILLLWLSHLLLTPFDLASISPARRPGDGTVIPVLVGRIVELGVRLLSSSTKAQDAAATLLVRLVTRPDMLKLGLCTSLSSQLSLAMQPKLSADSTNSIYELIGPLRFYAGITMASADDRLGVADLYSNCWELSQDSSSRLADNAVAKKLFVKVFRNTAITALRAASQPSKLTGMLETSSLVEDVIEYLLSSLGDRDTPVRYAAAKALSRLVLELEPTMGHEVIQAVLDSFKEDMPRNSEALDFRTANPLKWHGLTLTLAHMLFKRSAAPAQLHDIINALVSALQFEQRTATGSSMGTNVRDSANFGLWSLSRRYTTEELLSVDTTQLKSTLAAIERQSVIQALATNLVLSSCLDPVGNIRRGSSAALQELVGRHPNKVVEGIALVQIVDYQAVGLRKRAMVDVAARAAGLDDSHMEYWNALIEGLLGWRGIGSPDVLSREAAGAALAELGTSRFDSANKVLSTVKAHLLRQREVEELHGLILALTHLLQYIEQTGSATSVVGGDQDPLTVLDIKHILTLIVDAIQKLTARVMQSELPIAIARLLAPLCKCLTETTSSEDLPIALIDTLAERLFNRYEESIQQAIPPLASAFLALKRQHTLPLGCIGPQALLQNVTVDSSKSGSLKGACGAMALGALAPLYGPGASGKFTSMIYRVLADLMDATNVDWRIVGLRALGLTIEHIGDDASYEGGLSQTLINAAHRGSNDYTIDERGDVGSLVRLQAIVLASDIFTKPVLLTQLELVEIMQADMYRLSLEKLDRVRLAAAQCCSNHLDLDNRVEDAASVSSQECVLRRLAPLTRNEPVWKHRALLEGCVSCAGTSSESLLQVSRSALVQVLGDVSTKRLTGLLTIFASIMKSLLVDNSNNMHPALELLAFLFDMQIPQRLAESDFKWLNLLSTVQKSHHKSNDIPKILAAVNVYRGMAELPSVRGEVLKKLVSMLKTNPYPRVRLSVAEALYVMTKDEILKGKDWMKPTSANRDIVKQLQERYVGG